ncbi:hypothetical protein ciss_22650 [Carboxydothermus islandicus]|uniref:DUF1538 domain-containing protein n=1 Tax=Carboxydothermus islandicus TaxID=661089 RepID=A0A1L8D586_9THEO|nr:DUF1538 domain-containing protein [Carboxydothermus islandicus]GAV26332.1 hypothetical protein ciss_22650 [Carboxydothermus islandicus]
MQKIKNILFEVIYAVLPVTVVIITLQAILRSSIDIIIQFLIGVIMVTIGLILFSLGVQIGLLPLGETIGAALPKTGKAWVVILFGFLLGFVVTVAEPDVRVLTTQIDIVSKGVISKNLLISAVALGVAIFVGLAILRIILGIPMKHLLIVAYGLVFILAFFTPAEFLAISFDAGGVTTGPVTVPFIIALGIGVASVLGGKSASSDGFGLIALASVGPILAVLLLGVIFR